MAQLQMKHMKTKDIIVNPQVRKDCDPKAQDELTASVKAYGILQPLLVMISNVLLAGHRRLTAALAAGLETVPVIVTDRLLSDSEIRVIQLTENIHRADLKPIERVDGLEELARLNPGMNNKDLADLLHIDPSMVTRLRSVSTVIPSARDALAAGTIGLSMVYAISKCESAADQERMLAQALSGASRDAIEQAARATRNGRDKPETPPERSERVKIPLSVSTKEATARGTVTVASLPGKGIDLQEAEKLLKEALRSVREAQSKGWGLKAAQAAWRDMAKQGEG